jgi:hypothetical protein
MDTRYHIEEMVSQDASGVVFQGMDSVTGVIVAMRRFIASGSGVESVSDQDRQAYSDAIAVLKKVTHPSLRRVLAGGCDPVDEMPYLVTRWIDGESLGVLLASKESLDAECAAYILRQFLDANAAVSEALGTEGLWLEMAFESMIVKPPRDPSESPVALFWLCPWRWLHANSPANGITGLADLAEAMLGGPRKMASGNHGGELSQWIRQIRDKEFQTIEAAQQALKAPGMFADPFESDPIPPQEDKVVVDREKAEPLIAGFDPPGLQVAPTPIPSIAGRAVLPSAPEQRKVVTPAVIAAAAAVFGLILFFYWLAMGGDKDSSKTADDPSVVPVSRSQAKIDEMMTQIQGENSATEERRKHIERRGYYTIDDVDLMLARDKEEVTLRGRLARVRMSSSGLTMYLEFSEAAPNSEPRAYAMSCNLVDGIRPEDLEQFIGRQMEIRGPVDIENIVGTRRPRVKIIDRDHINVLGADQDYELR